MQNSSLKIFIAFAKEDRDVRDKLLRQMNLVKTREGWDIWASHEIKAGAVWNEEIKARLAESEVVVLLMSSSFFNSNYILEVELPAIVEKHRAGNCHIVPVLARHCLWKDTSFGDYAELGDIQALPADEKPIVSKGNWDSEEEPYVETVQGLKAGIQGFKDKMAKQAGLKKVEQQRIENEKAKKEAENAKETRSVIERLESESVQKAEQEREAQLIIERHEREAELKAEQEQTPRQAIERHEKGNIPPAERQRTVPFQIEKPKKSKNKLFPYRKIALFELVILTLYIYFNFIFEKRHDFSVGEHIAWVFNLLMFFPGLTIFLFELLSSDEDNFDHSRLKYEFEYTGVDVYLYKSKISQIRGFYLLTALCLLLIGYWCYELF